MMFIISSLPVLAGSEDASSVEPTKSVQFIDVAEERFDQLTHMNFISAGDWNSDGYVDLLFNGYRLFENSGPPTWNFTYQASVFGSSTAGASNGVWADWDGDGDLDLFQGCRKDTADRFFENQGAPGYELVDVSSTVFGSWENLGPNTGSSWGDMDRDGDLDLYVGSGEDWNDGHPIYFPDFFLRNEGGVSFTDISSSIGIRTGENFYSRGATWGDFNNDRWQDVYVSHYRIRENHLFVNQRGGTFDEEGTLRNCSGTFDETWYYDNTAGQVYGQSWWGPTYGHTIGSSWADFNRDGNLDLWTSDFVHKYVGYIGDWYDIRGYICDDANLYINEGAPYYTFTDYRNTSGIPKWPIGGQGVYQGDQTFSGVTIGDHDNDGWEDMYIPQVYGNLPYTTPHFYHNLGAVQDGSVPNGTTFDDITTSLGIKGANTYANLFLDLDNDGDLDLLTGGGDTWDGSKWTGYRVRLFENQGTGDNNWLKVKLNGPGMNPDAVGARVTLNIPQEGSRDHILTREVRSGTGHAHQGDSTLHFGLGTGDVPDRVRIEWPDGKVQYVTVGAVDRTMEVNYPLDVFPEIGTVSILPSNVREDSTVTITVGGTAGSADIKNYRWDMDGDNLFDRVTSTGSISLGVYEGGPIHVRCELIDTNMLADEVYPIIVDVINTEPVVTVSDVEVDMDTVLVPGEDTITDTPSDLANISWMLDWGDGVIENGIGPLLPSHMYTLPGTYTFSITASDEEFDIIEQGQVTVNNIDPWGWLEVKGGNTSTFNEDDRIRFFPHIFDSPSDTSTFQVRWDFGSGGTGDLTSVSDMVHSYEENGEYSVTVFVHDEHDGVGMIVRNITILNREPVLDLADPVYSTMHVMEDEVLDIDDIIVPVDSSSDLLDLEFKWEFGDASWTEWRSTPDIGHIYDRSGEYDAVCFVRDDDGDIGNITITVMVENPAPVMGAVSQFAEVWEDQEFLIAFSAKDNPSDEEALSFFIDLGDGRVLEAATGAQISYPSSGIYEITVTVKDDDGAMDSSTAPITVKNRPPTGEISASSMSVDEDEKIKLSAGSIEDSLADIGNITASWDMDDGSDVLHGMSIEHVYSGRGKYQVKLMLFDGDQIAIVTTTITVNDPVPVAEFTFLPLDPLVGDTISLDASNSTDNPSDIDTLAYYWDLGDGSSKEGMMIEHSYSEGGTYAVILEVVDDDTSSAFYQLDITVAGITDEHVPKEKDSGIMIIVVGAAFTLLLVSALLVTSALIIRKRRSRQVFLPPPDIQTSDMLYGNVPPDLPPPLDQN
ncbi:MAG: PKD domain-containing protein, partial [Candidatus Thermoplasmatota archaeon]|nr:PKD domain-containing protein [Candidatus Thermoplasmatota archaeon]